VEELRLGAVDGSGPEVFGRIVGLEVDRDERIYVLDALSREIRIFDRMGRHQRNVARPGRGPGELETPMGLALDPSGNLWVPDLGNSRYAVFAPDGEVLKHVSRPPTVGFTYWPGGIDQTGLIWDADRIRGATTEQLLLRVSPSGEIQDTVRLPASDMTTYDFESRAVRMFAAVPYSSALLWAVSPDGFVWLGLSGEYRLFKTISVADTVLSIESEYPPIRITDEERATALENDPGASRIRELGGRTDPDLIPAFKPAFTRLVIARDGAVWVWRSAADSRDPLIDVFSPEGQAMGSALGPDGLASAPRPIIYDDYMVAVTTDDLGVAYVTRFRIER
jgi:sugar lactone lactonase YvrE